MLRWTTTFIPNQQITDAVRRFESLLREGISRTEVRRRRNAEFLHFIKIVHVHEVARATRIRNILKDPAIISLHPNPRIASQIRICDKMVPPVGLKLANCTEVALGVTSNIPIPEPHGCPCHRILPHCCDQVDGHVVTIDYTSIPDPYLQQLFSEGSKYRLNCSPEDILPKLDIGLKEYCDKYINKLQASCQGGAT